MRKKQIEHLQIQDLYTHANRTNSILCAVLFLFVAILKREYPVVLIQLDIALTIGSIIFYTFKQLTYHTYIKAYYRFSYDPFLKIPLVLLQGAPLRLAILVGYFLYSNLMITSFYEILSGTLFYCIMYAPTSFQVSVSIIFSCFMIYHFYYSQRKVTILAYSDCLSSVMAETHSPLYQCYHTTDYLFFSNNDPSVIKPSTPNNVISLKSAKKNRASI